MKKNIRMVLLGEMLLFLAIFLFILFFSAWGLSTIVWFLDLPSLLCIILILIPGLIIMGEYLRKEDFSDGFESEMRKQLNNRPCPPMTKE